MEQKGALAIQPFVHHRCHVRTEAHALHYFLERLGIPWVVRADDGLLIKNGRFLWESWVFSSLQRGVSDRIWCMQYTFPPPLQNALVTTKISSFLGQGGPIQTLQIQKSTISRGWTDLPLPRLHLCYLIQDGICSWSKRSLMWEMVYLECIVVMQSWNKMFSSVLVFGSRKSIWDTWCPQRYMILLIIDFGLQYVFPASYELLWSKSIDKTWISWMFFQMS